MGGVGLTGTTRGSVRSSLRTVGGSGASCGLVRDAEDFVVDGRLGATARERWGA